MGLIKCASILYVVCRSDQPIFNLGRLSKAAYCIFYLTIKDIFLKVRWGLWYLEMCTKFKFENLNLQYLHFLPVFAFSDIINMALMLFALLLPRWTCSPMAWFCTSYWPGKGPHWDTTSYRSLKSFPKASDRCWATQKKCSSSVSRSCWLNAGTPSLRRWDLLLYFFLPRAILTLFRISYFWTLLN